MPRVRLTDRQFAVLQSVAYACYGAECADTEAIRMVPEVFKGCGAAKGLSERRWELVFDLLVKVGLCLRQTHKNVVHVGLTPAGSKYPGLDPTIPY